MPEEEEKQSALRLAGGAQQLGSTACDESVTLTASYDITSLSASLSLHAGRCHCMLAVYLAASTTLSTSLSLHAGRLRRPAELSRIEDAGPRPILSETFFKHLRTWELENDFNLLCDPPGGFVSGLSRLQGPCKLVVSGGVTRGRVARDAMWRRHRGSDVPKRKRRNNPKRDQEWEPQQGGRPLSILED